MTKSAILFLIITLFSCSETINNNQPIPRINIFLDFELGMTISEYRSYEKSLEKKGIKLYKDNSSLKLDVLNRGKELIIYSGNFTEHKGVEYLTSFRVIISNVKGERNAKKLFELIERKGYRLNKGLKYKKSETWEVRQEEPHYEAEWGKSKKYVVNLYVPDEGSFPSAVIRYRAYNKHITKQHTPF